MTNTGLSSLSAIGAENNVLEHPFYVRWSAGELSAAELALFRAERDRIDCGGPDVAVLNLFEDSRRIVWGTGVQGVWRLKPEPRVLYPLDGAAREGAPLVEDADGDLVDALSDLANTELFPDWMQ